MRPQPAANVGLVAPKGLIERPSLRSTPTARAGSAAALRRLTRVSSAPIQESEVNRDAALGFNAYVYDRYATIGHSNHNSSKFADSGNLALLSSREIGGPVAIVDSGSGAAAITLN